MKTKREKIIEVLAELMMDSKVASKVDDMVRANTVAEVNATYDFFHANYHTENISERCYARLMWNLI